MSNEDEVINEAEQILRQAKQTMNEARRDMTVRSLPHMVKSLEDWINENPDPRFTDNPVRIGFIIPDANADVCKIAEGDMPVYMPVTADEVRAHPEEYCAGKMMPFYGFSDYKYAIECLEHKGMALIVSDLVPEDSATVLYDKELSVLIAGSCLTIILKKPLDTMTFHAVMDEGKPLESEMDWVKENLTKLQRKLLRTLLEWRLYPLGLKEHMPETYKAMLNETRKRMDEMDEGRENDQ